MGQEEYLNSLGEQLKEAKFTEATLEEIEGQKVFVVTDETVDRDGEIISIEGWNLDNFKRNPIMLWSHNPFEPMIGRWKNLRYRTVNGKKKLTMEPEFHRKSPLSQLIADLVDSGWMLTTSVGFRPFKKEGNRFTAQEMLEVSFVNIPANPEATELALSKGYGNDVVGKVFGSSEEQKTVIPFKETPMAEKGMAWDGPEMMAMAEVSDLKAMCAWYDAENPDVKSSYKLPHHMAMGDHAVVWRGVVAAMSALLGARGGTNIPASDRQGVYNHLARHYEQFGEEAPEFRDYDEAELKSLYPDLYPANQAEIARLEGLVSQLTDEIKGLQVALQAKATSEPQPKAVKGRSEDDAKSSKIRRLLQISNKALDQALALSKPRS